MSAVYGRKSIRDLTFVRRDGQHLMEVLGWVNLIGNRAICVVTEDMDNYLDNEHFLQNYCSIHLSGELAHVPMLNELCLCLIPSKGWFRAVIIGRRDDRLLIYAIDIGSVQAVGGEFIRAMRDDVMFPVFAISCDLNVANYEEKRDFCASHSYFTGNLHSSTQTPVHRVN